MSEVPEGYKMSEVGVIPEEWKVKTLGDVSEIIMGQSPAGNSYNQNANGIALINGPTEFTEKYPIKIQWTTLPTKLCKEGDILLCIRGSSTGRMNISNDSYCIGRGVAAIRAKVNSDCSFLEFQVQNVVKNILALTTGSTFPNIDGRTLKNITVAFPPLPEQQAIASALSDVDALITALEQLITKKRNIKQGAMQQLLTGKKRLPGFSGAWEVKKLGEIAEIQRGASPRPIDSPIWYDTKSKVGWVRISDVTTSNGKNLSKTKDYLSEKGISQSRFLPKNSLIMSICATVGIPVITSIETCIHDGFIGFSKLHTIDKEFLFYKLKELENSFKSMGQTGSQNNLNSDLVRNCTIKIPTLPEQQSIAQILSDMDTEIESLEQKRNKYKAIKQGMMQELLTGKRRLLA